MKESLSRRRRNRRSTLQSQNKDVYIDGGGEKTAGNNMDGSTSYPKLSHHIKQHYSTRYGVETGEVDIVVHALPMSGRKDAIGAGKGRITLEKQWHNISQPFRPPGHREGHPGGGPRWRTPYCTVEELFPTGAAAFMLGQPHYLTSSSRSTESTRARSSSSSPSTPSLISLRSSRDTSPRATCRDTRRRRGPGFLGYFMMNLKLKKWQNLKHLLSLGG